ncbi:MAG: ABC transporter ATP-binding protein [Verrucomicrobiales bacterium]|nr:ABC transporter ATP-binding protein [Verrucomicrobiales bacterium]
MTDSPAILRFEDVSRRFAKNETPAVDRVSLDIPAGEIFALIGASGSGKTTLLRIAAGLDSPDSGKVYLGEICVADAGKPAQNLPPEHRQIGLVAQEGALFPHLNVTKNVAFGLAGWKREERDDRVAECLQIVDLGGKEKRFPHELSGGERQRLALARALAPGPEILLLDEPFSHLDPSLRRTLREEIKSILSELRQTALLVTHDPEDALAIAHHLAVLESGRVIQQGAPADVYRNPVNQYCAERFGAANGVLDPETGETKWTRPEEARWLSCEVADEGTAVTVLSVTPLGHLYEVRVQTDDEKKSEWLCILREGEFLKTGDKGRIAWRGNPGTVAWKS